MPRRNRQQISEIFVDFALIPVKEATPTRIVEEFKTQFLLNEKKDEEEDIPSFSNLFDILNQK